MYLKLRELGVYNLFGTDEATAIDSKVCADVPEYCGAKKEYTDTSYWQA